VTTDAAIDNKPAKGRDPRVWVSTLYFAEGLPYMLVRFLPSVYLTDIGVKEVYLGLLNFLGLPWNTKFLWAPAVDLYGTKRGWLLKIQGLITLAAVVLGGLALLGPSVLAPGAAGTDAASTAAAADWAVRGMLAVLVALAFVAATHDVAIDGYYMEAISDPGEQAAYTGIRVLTYRLAIVFARGGLVALAAWAGWTAGWMGAACAMAALLALHAWILPRVEVARVRMGTLAEEARGFLKAFTTWLDQPRILLVLLFVITYKLGDEVLFSMHTPFLLRELGLPKEDFAWVMGIVGMIFGIAGSLFSARLVAKWGLERAIWPLTLGMNVNICAYVWLAWSKPDPSTVAGLATIVAVVAYEQLAAGLGNAVLVVWIMRTCRAEYKAAHYAVASALAALGGTIFGGFGGLIVEQVGYTGLYGFAFAAALPSMVLLAVLKVPPERAALAA